MADRMTREERSRAMGRVAQFNTPPELLVRKILHRLGRRFRLHRKDLPGRPDIVLSKSKKAIFVHGCFWHRHDCRKATTPKTNVEFWNKKFADNVARDKKAIAELQCLGWGSMIVWECQTSDIDALTESLAAFASD